MSPKTGRPPSANPKSEGFHIRVTPKEKQEITKICKENNLTLLDLIRIGMEKVKGQ